MKVQVIRSAKAPSPMAHYCQGVLAGETLYAAGQIASDYKTGVPSEARQDPAFPYYGSDIQKQTRYVLENLRSVFEAAGCRLSDVVKSQVFLTDLNDFHFFDQVWKEFFPSPPPRTTVQVSGLLVPGCRVEIDLTAVLPSADKRVITGATTPTPMAHYCQGIMVGDTLYAAGQIASDYHTGVPPEARQDPAFPFYGSDIQKQTRYVLENIQAVYRAAGCELADTVKSQVFLTDLDDFFYFDQVWKEFFPSPPPRTTVQINKLLVPGCRVEIDLTAVHKRAKRTVVSGSRTPTPMAHYCQGVMLGETLYAAGQIASDYKTGVPPEAMQDPAFPYYGSTIQKQTRYILENIRAVYLAAGLDLKDTVKSQVFMTDLNDFYYFDQVWKEFFPSPPPRTTVQVSRLLVPGCRIEIDLTAVKST
jgi:reactive intermediate/imine deaminase